MNPCDRSALKDLFLIEAARYQVLPIDDRKAVRLDSAVTGRPDLMGGRTSLTLHPGATHLGEATVPNVKNRSHSVTADSTVGDTPAPGGDRRPGRPVGRLDLYLDDGAPQNCHNWVDHEYRYVKAAQPLSPGRHTVRYEFDYDGGGPGKGGTGRLLVDGAVAAEGRIDNTCGYMCSTTDGLDIGRDNDATVIDHYRAPGGGCTATVRSVTIDIAPQADNDPEGTAKAIVMRQ